MGRSYSTGPAARYGTIRLLLILPIVFSVVAMTLGPGLPVANAANGSISGTVTASGGGPLEGVSVTASDAFGIEFPSITNASGYYIINELPEGCYDVEAIHPTNTTYRISDIKIVNLPSDTGITGIDFQLETGALTLAGTVTYGAGGLAGVSVQIEHEIGYEKIFVTGGDGSYSFTNLPPGEVGISVRSGDPNLAYTGRKIQLTSNATEDFALVVEACVTGQVVDAQGNGVGNVWVQYDNPRHRMGHGMTTDGSGNFTLCELPPGIGNITANPHNINDGYCDTENRYLDLGQGETRNVGQIKLQRCALVNGTLSTTEPDKICEMGFYLDGVESSGYGFDADADLDDTYQLRLPAGDHYISLDKDKGILFPFVARPVKVTVTVSDVLNDTPVSAPNMEIISYANSNAATISGTLIKANSEDPDPSGRLFIGVFPQGVITNVTAENFRQTGAVVQENVLPGFGQYTLSPVAPTSADLHYTLICGMIIEGPDELMSFTRIGLPYEDIEILAGQDLINRDFTYVDGGRPTIGGRVLDHLGNPVLAALVLVTDAADKLIAFAYTDQNGEYTLYNLPAGTFTVQADHPEHGDGPTSAITIPADTSISDITLDPAPWTPGSISGTVVNELGAPMPGMLVVAFDFAKTTVAAQVLTGPGGSYVLDLTPGSYLIVATASDTFYAHEFYNGVHNMEDATPVAVNPGAATSPINFQMDKGGWISGQVVRSSDGAPIENASVTAYEYATNKWAGNQETEADGTYTIQGLMPGTYRLKVDQGGLATEYYDNTLDPDAATPVVVSVDAEQTGIDFALEANFSIDGSISRVRNPDATYLTLIEIVVGSDFPGNVLTDISSVRVNGPSGFERIYSPADPEWSVSADGKTYTLIINGFTPALGIYTFTVSGANAIATTTDYQYILRSLPIVDPGSRSPANGAIVTSPTPVFQWDLVKYPAEPDLALFYRFQIRVAGGATVYSTARIQNFRFSAVPDGILQPGQTYEWRVRVSDSDDWIKVQNRSNSGWQTIIMANPLSHLSKPAVAPDSLKVVTWNTDNGIGGYAEVRVIDLDGISSDGKSHTVTVTPPGGGPVQLNFDSLTSPTSAYYSIYNPGLPPAGDYVFTVTDPEGLIGAITDTLTVNPLSPPDATSLAPSAINKTITASFDNVYVNGAAYDFFDTYTSIYELNPERWESWSPSGTAISDGAVVMSLGNSVGRAHAGLNFANPELIDTIQADITVNDTNDPGNATRARISGYWYNNGTNDVWASIQVNGSKVYWTVNNEFINEQGTWEWPNLGGGDLLTGVGAGETVTASIAWDGSKLTFSASTPSSGSATQYYTPSGTINPPVDPGKHLQTRIHFSTDTIPLFSWDPIPGAKRYRARIYNHDATKTIWRGLTTGDEAFYQIPPGILKPDAFYRLRLDAWDDGNPPLDIDNWSKTPPNNGDALIFYTNAQESADPYLELDSTGVHTFNSETEGAVLAFWVMVHDAQGVPGNIKNVKVQHPDGPQLELQAACSNAWQPATPTSCIYYAQTGSLPITAGTYIFTVEDNDGHTATPVSEDFVPDVIGYPDKANHLPANGATVGSTAVSFNWDDVPGRAFYTLAIYDYDFKLVYQFHTTQSSYALPEGFLKEGTPYLWRVLTRRELFSKNDGVNPSHVDNVSSSPSSSNMFTFTTTAATDSDGDGMPDWWETLYFGDLSHDGTADTDGDGLTDLQEYQGDSDPNSETDLPAFSQFYIGGAGASDDNVGNQANPVQTLHAAVRIMNSLATGAYELNLAPGSGPFTFASEGSDTPLVIEQNVTINGGFNTLDGSGDHGSAADPWTTGIIFNTGANDVAIHDLTIQNFDAGISVRSDGGCVLFANVGLTSNGVGLQLLESQMVDVDLGGNVIGGNGTGIEITGASANNTIRNGTVSNNSGNGIRIVASSDSPYDNLITNVDVEYNGQNGIELRDGSANQVSDCRFTGNNISLTGYGGAAILGGCAIIKWNIFDNNQCAGIYAEESRTSEIHGNLLYQNSVGIKLSFTSETIIQNNTITSNTDGLVIEEGSSPEVMYNIIWGNGGGSTDLVVFGDYARLEYNDIGTTSLPGLPASNISLDPRLTGSYRLESASPCIDACGSYAEPGRDLDGQPRPKGYVWDMGAYESAAYADADGDLMADWWEQQIVDANPNDGITVIDQVLPDGDFDGDGINNLDEYLAGTNPLTALALTIDDPAGYLIYTDSASMAVSGTAQSAGWITVTLNGAVIDTLDSGLESWAVNSIPLVGGQNLISVAASDGAFTITESISVIRDNAAPAVTITNPPNEGTYETSLASISLTGVSSDDTLLDSVTWQRTAGNDTISGSAAGTKTWAIGGIALIPGENNAVTVTARDVFGNTGSATVTITIIANVTSSQQPPAESLAASPVDPLDLDGDNYLNDDETACFSNPEDGDSQPPNLKTSFYPTDPLDPYFKPDKVKRDSNGTIIGSYLWPDCLNPDDDRDGMPDAWETKYGFDPQDDTDWDDDPDGDGDTNLAEYQNGTDPTRAPLAELQVTLLDNAVQPVYGNWLPKYRANESDNLRIQVQWIGGGAPNRLKFTLTNTSRYPGRAENDPDPAESVTTYPPWYDFNGFDFGLTTDPTDHSYNQGPIEVMDSADGAADGIYSIYLQCWDYGGRTKLVVSHPTDSNTQVQIWIPRGSGSTGISSNWPYDNGSERLNPNADIDAIKFDNPGEFTAPPGDDLNNFQEYRGIVYSLDGGNSLTHQRLNPHHKDLFLRTEGFDAEYPFAIGNALANAEIDVHDTTGWGHDATEDKSFFVYYRTGSISAISGKTVTGDTSGWLTRWPQYEWEFKLVGDPEDAWMPISAWMDAGTMILALPYRGATGNFAPAKAYMVRMPLPPLNVMIARLDRTLPSLFSSDDGHIKFIIASPPSQQNPMGTRHYAWTTKGISYMGNTDEGYGVAIALKIPLDYYCDDKPYVKASVWDTTLSNWRAPTAGDQYLAPLSQCEDYLDSGDFIDGAMDETLGMMLGNAPNGQWDGDRRLMDPAQWNNPGNYSPFDVNHNGLVELPYVSHMDSILSEFEYTKAQILLHTVTHEIVHAMAISGHSKDPNGLMYRYSNNWSRADHLSDWYRSLLRVHNRRR